MLRTLGQNVGLDDQRVAELLQQANQFDQRELVYLIEKLGQAQSDIRAGLDARLQLELALVKVMRPQRRPLGGRSRGAPAAPGGGRPGGGRRRAAGRRLAPRRAGSGGADGPLGTTLPPSQAKRTPREPGGAGAEDVGGATDSGAGAETATRRRRRRGRRADPRAGAARLGARAAARPGQQRRPLRPVARRPADYASTATV